MKACRCGLKVVFRNASTLATKLREAKDDYHLQAMQMSLARVDLLLLDELSYAKFGQEESELLFKIIADRSERVSTLVTTNLSFSQWTEMFANAALTAALVDWLTFHSHILDMNGASYWLDSACKKRGKSGSVVACFFIDIHIILIIARIRHFYKPKKAIGNITSNRSILYLG